MLGPLQTLFSDLAHNDTYLASEPVLLPRSQLRCPDLGSTCPEERPPLLGELGKQVAIADGASGG